MAEIIATIVGLLDAASKLKANVVDPLKVHFSYLCGSNSIIQSLKVEQERLDSTRAHLQQAIVAARDNLELIGSDVDDWCRRVDELKMKTDRILGATPELQKGCLHGSCPNVTYSISREAKKLTEVAVGLQNESSKFNLNISYPAPPLGFETIPPVSDSGFDSRRSIEEEIIAGLRADTVYITGVCGMGGVGKTTMVNKIAKWASQENLFDFVVVAVVSQEPKVQDIQLQIAEALGLKLEKQTVPIRASLVHARLMDVKKVLIVLDDVWERLNLEEIGIPLHSIHKGCKIILTTRNHHICVEMDSSKIFQLEVLQDKEAFTLFQEKAGSVVDQPKLRQLATDVAKECKGLPLALVTVGSALREQNNVAVWKDALLQLRRSSPTNIPRVLKDVYQPLQLSYKELESDEARYLFLLCCLFPEDSRIDLENLVYYGIGLGIFSDIGNLGEARNRVCVLVENLKSRFLLMDATHYDYPMVKMHDVVRDMAIWISSKGTEHVFMVSHETGLSEWPKKDSCDNYTCISLTLRKSMVIPECMNCPKLEALIVDCKQSETLKLPDTFFNRMRGLRLLSISYCIVRSSSLSLLTQLRVLRLYNCGLRKMISLIGELLNLEILRLCGSDIEVLPDEMGALTKLKLLELSGCYNLKKISPGVISRLVQLEELRLLKCPIQWEGEEKGKERSNASLGEVFSLRNLNTLEIWIKDPQVILQDGDQLQKKLTSYSVIIGKTRETFDRRYTDQKRMIASVYEIKNPCVNLMCVLFMGAERLNLRGKGSKDIIEVLERQGFQNVEELEISKLDTAKHLASTIQQGAIFPVLRRLDLSYMKDLEEICDAPPPVGSFSKLEGIHLSNLPGLMYMWKCSNEKLCLPNLKNIQISNCEKLKWVFPLSIAESLCQLKTIKIWECPNIEEMFFKDEIRGSSEEGSDDNDHMNIKFPKLNGMTLYKLPKLCALCKAIDVFEFPEIKGLNIAGVSWNLKMLCSRRPDLFNKEVTFIHSKGLRMRQIDIFTGLRRLEIEDCFELRTLFSPNAFKSLINLKKLKVRNCLILEEIVEKHEDEEKLVIPQLEILQLSKLPQILCFCTFKNALELPSLQEITILDCPLMETFAVESCSSTIMPNSIPKFFFCKKVSCPNLCKLVINGIKTASVIFSHEFRISELEVLEVKDCHDFKSMVGKEDDDSIPKCFISKEVPRSKLKSLVLHGLKFEGLIFSQELSIGYLSALEILKVESCHSLKSLFAPSLFGEITNLQDLVVRDCSMLEVVFAEEGVDDGSWEEKIIKGSKFEKIELSKLPNLRSFYKSFESIHLPKWVNIYGIKDPEFASRVFFNKEHRQDEDNLSKGCFMLSPSDVSFTCQYRTESLFLVKGLSDVFFHAGWFKVCGSFGIDKLSPNITYEIIFVLMLRKKHVLMLRKKHVKVVTVVAEDVREEDMSDKPMEEWIEIKAGEFRASSVQSEEIEFSLTNNVHLREGIIFKCVHIRPKESIT